MLAFGIIGLVLAGIVAGALVAGGIAARNLDDRIVAAQDRIGAALTRLTLTMDGVATSIDNASTTLGTSRDGVVHAADVLGQMAGTSDELASALNVTILGQQPFTAAVTKLSDLSAKVRVFQGDATKLAANLDANASDVTQMAGQVRQLRSEVGDLAAAVAGFSSTREVVSLVVGGIVLAGLLTAWVAVLAAGIAWAGWRLRRAVPPGAVAPA